MITTEKYLKSAVIKNFNNQANTYTMPSQDANNVISVISHKSLFKDFCTKAQVSDVSASSITFAKLGEGLLQPKGSALNTTYLSHNMDQVEVKYSKPLTIESTFSAAEKALGVPDASAQKMTKYLDQFLKNHERLAFAEVETVSTTAQTLKANATAEEIYRAIIKTATALTTTKTGGIDLIDREDIVIHIKPEIFDDLMAINKVGNYAEKAFVDGQYAVYTIGGYKIKANPYLTTHPVIVSTNFSCGGGLKIVANNIGRFGNTSDIALYFEALEAHGVVFPELIKNIKIGQ